MEFNPHNPIIRLCTAGTDKLELGNILEATEIYKRACDEASHDFEKFIAAFFMGKVQPSPSSALQWLRLSLEHGLKVNNLSVQSALPSLYTMIADCYGKLDDAEKEIQYRQQAELAGKNIPDKGPFYHGTRADLQLGDLLVPGGVSNYQDDLVMNHIYFTALIPGAGLAAALAKGDTPERVYIVEPTGSFENDPNVTDKKFPGNPTRSYRSAHPLKIVGEVKDWPRLPLEEITKWKERLAKMEGKIIN